MHDALMSFFGAGDALQDEDDRAPGRTDVDWLESGVQDQYPAIHRNTSLKTKAPTGTPARAMDFDALINAPNGCAIEIVFAEGICGAREIATPRLRLMD
jgi:hypothetical protein